MASESVPPAEDEGPTAEAEVHTNQDNGDDFEVDTCVALDGSFRTWRTRSKETREWGEDKAGPSNPTIKPVGLPQAAEGAAP
ncbi:unnamed protein product [Amaranthus hypochondriacus]